MRFRPVAVYVPRAGGDLEKFVDPRSAIVGSPATEWLRPSQAEEVAEALLSDEDRRAVVIDYEGNRYGAANMRTFADRCLHAAGRHVDHYPTIARMFVRDDSVMRVGSFDGETLTVEDHDSLANWLDIGDLHAELVLS